MVAREHEATGCKYHTAGVGRTASRLGRRATLVRADEGFSVTQIHTDLPPNPSARTVGLSGSDRSINFFPVLRIIFMTTLVNASSKVCFSRSKISEISFDR